MHIVRTKCGMFVLGEKTARQSEDAAGSWRISFPDSQAGRQARDWASGGSSGRPACQDWERVEAVAGEGGEQVPAQKVGTGGAGDTEEDRKSTRLNSSHTVSSRMPSSA